jgi:hypothetical protein
MNRYPDKKQRERIIANWPISQATCLLGMAMAVVMPFAWNWPDRVAKGLMSWTDIAARAALVWAFCLGVGELIRRSSNRQIGEGLCKWIWQK